MPETPATAAPIIRPLMASRVATEGKFQNLCRRISNRSRDSIFGRSWPLLAKEANSVEIEAVDGWGAAEWRPGPRVATAGS